MRHLFLAVILLFSSITSFAASYEDGVSAYSNRDYQRAYSIWMPLAKQGDALAQNNLGHMYSAGKGVTRNYDEAIKWYKLAAENGLPNSQVSLGWYYMNGFGNLSSSSIDYQLAIYWNERGAKGGSAEGYNNLGWLYENGLGVKKDLRKAADYYQSAISEGVRLGAEQKNLNEAIERLQHVQSLLVSNQSHKKQNKIRQSPKTNENLKRDPLGLDPLNIR